MSEGEGNGSSRASRAATEAGPLPPGAEPSGAVRWVDDAERVKAVGWLDGLRDHGHCGEGTLERNARQSREDQIDRCVRLITAPLSAHDTSGEKMQSRDTIESLKAALGEAERERDRLKDEAEQAWMEVEGLHATLQAAELRASTAEQRVGEAERLLEPFARFKASSLYPDDGSEGDEVYVLTFNPPGHGGPNDLKGSDFRAAAAFLSKGKGA